MRASAAFYSAERFIYCRPVDYKRLTRARTPTCSRSDAGCHILAESGVLRLYNSWFSFRSPVHICSLSQLDCVSSFSLNCSGDEGCALLRLAVVFTLATRWKYLRSLPVGGRIRGAFMCCRKIQYLAALGIHLFFALYFAYGGFTI